MTVHVRLLPHQTNGRVNAVVYLGGTVFATVLAMDVSPDGDTLYFSGDFALVNGKSRRNAAAVSTGIATLRAWSPASSGDVAGDIILSPSGRMGSWAAGPPAATCRPTAPTLTARASSPPSPARATRASCSSLAPPRR